MPTRKELLEAHSNKDENDEAIINDIIPISNEQKELYKEVLVIEGGDNREMIRTMKVVLKKLEDVEYEKRDSEIYDYLCDQFDIDDEEEKEKK